MDFVSVIYTRVAVQIMRVFGRRSRLGLLIALKSFFIKLIFMTHKLESYKFSQ